MEGNKLTGTLLIIGVDMPAAEALWTTIAHRKQIKDNVWTTKYYTAAITPIYATFSATISYSQVDCIIYIPAADKATYKRIAEVNESITHDTSLIYTDYQADTELLEFSTSNMIELVENDLSRLVEALDCASWRGMQLVDPKEQKKSAEPKSDSDKVDAMAKEEYEYLADDEDKDDKLASLLEEMRKMKEGGQSMGSDERIEKAAQLMGKLEELIGGDEL